MLEIVFQRLSKTVINDPKQVLEVLQDTPKLETLIVSDYFLPLRRKTQNFTHGVKYSFHIVMDLCIKAQDTNLWITKAKRYFSEGQTTLKLILLT